MRCKIIFGACLLAMNLSVSASTTDEHPVSVLFIGNSLTYYNAMPATFARMVESTQPGMRLYVRSVASDGAMLEDHWKLDWTRTRLAERHWDFVVLQDQGALSRWVEDGKSHQAPPASLDAYVDKFARLARDAGSTVVLYETAPTGADRMPYIAWAYTQAANRERAILAPAGSVLYALDDDARKIMLPKGGGGHPSPRGSCVIAATLASAMFRAPSQPMLDSCASGDEAVRAAGPLIDRQLVSMGQPGGYHVPAAPHFDPPPSVTPGQPVGVSDTAGRWYARESGLPMSFGVRLSFGKATVEPEVAIDNYGVNTRQGMRIDSVDRAHGLIRIDSHGDGRTYRYTLARHGNTLSGYLAAYVNGGTTYTPVSFVHRDAADGHFTRLDDLQGTFDRERKELGLDAALLGRYKALNAWLGTEEVKRVAWADPASDAWYALLTGQNYADLGNDTLALEYYTFAVRHFPKSYDAYGARGQLLERMGRFGEALPDLTRAAAMLAADHRSDGETEYSWRRDRVRQSLMPRQKDSPVATQ
ncbi:hypothetical protein [Luteibacter sp.]|uniref:hypothetical protein n=1 Tax=Luteibacter sp. TaxID=1886636 RepID=UPI003F8098D9